MYADNTVFSKTALGQKELTNTQLSKLPRALRNFLILIDGKKTFSQYKNLLNNSRLLKADKTLEDHFNALLELDLIKPEGRPGSYKNQTPDPLTRDQNRTPATQETAKSPVVTSPVQRPAAAARMQVASLRSVEQDLKFKELHSLIIECVEKELGGFNWEATLELERCQTPDELRKAISRVYETNKADLSRDGKKTLKNTYKLLASLKA